MLLKSLLSLLLLVGTAGLHTSTSQHKPQSMDNKTFSVEVIRYNIPQDKGAAFEKAYAEAGKHLQASPYCLGYQVLHGNDEPDHYMVIIHWTSKEEHLQGFRKSQEFGPFFNLVKPFYNNIEEMKHYDQTATTWTK
jgi:quinol monooxygenase YgiN